MESYIHYLETAVEVVGITIDVAGVCVIVIGIAFACTRYIQRSRANPHIDHYRSFKVRIGRALQLGLEVLVAADIIKTVALEPTLESLAVLAGLVLIRTFLSWTLVVEIEGRWPWQAPLEGYEVDLSK